MHVKICTNVGMKQRRFLRRPISFEQKTSKALGIFTTGANGNGFTLRHPLLSYKGTKITLAFVIPRVSVMAERTFQEERVCALALPHVYDGLLMH